MRQGRYRYPASQTVVVKYTAVEKAYCHLSFLTLTYWKHEFLLRRSVYVSKHVEDVAGTGDDRSKAPVDTVCVRFLYYTE
jgi:hypothetical protein